MKLLRFKLAALLPLLLCSQSLSAEPPPVSAAQESFNNAAGALKDPTVMSKEMEQKLAGALPSPVNGANKGGLEDPTQMNQNFREALQGGVQNKTGTVANGPAPAAPDMSKIKLLAIVLGGNKDKTSAMLSFGNERFIVYVGDVFSHFLNNMNSGSEYQVLDITKHHVELLMLPAHKKIILR